MPPGVDLLVLNAAPLEIAGGIALDGLLVLEVDEVARVRWEARTRKILSDERYRIDRSHREFLEAAVVVDEIQVVRLLRSSGDSLRCLAAERTADATRRSDPTWLPGIKYLMIAAIECCVDVAQHICSAERWGAPRDNADALRILGEHGVVARSTADAMRLAVGFRNVLVHEHVDVDDAIPVARLADLTDVERFVGEVAGLLG